MKKQDGIFGRESRKARDQKNGMTLNEMAAFVDAARAKGIHGESKVQVDMTWRQSAKGLTVEGQVIPNGEEQKDVECGTRPKLPREWKKETDG